MTPEAPRTMKVLSIDLAYKRAEDVGVCLLRTASRNSIEVEFPSPKVLGILDPLEPEKFAQRVLSFCKRERIRLVMIDGPQAWKNPQSELKHSRSCERTLNAPAKTGVKGSVKPRNYLPFVSFSASVFSHLVNLGTSLIEKAPFKMRKTLVAAEILPLSAWRELKIKPLPAKRKCPAYEIEWRFETLKELFTIRASQTPNHDQLQALVSGLGGLSMVRGHTEGYMLVGQPSHWLGEHWVEGYIVNPRRLRNGDADDFLSSVRKREKLRK